MKEINQENQFNHTQTTSDWQDLPELELFDDELSFVKKHEAESLIETEDLDELELSTTDIRDLDELGLTDLESLEESKSQPEQVDPDAEPAHKPALKNSSTEQINEKLLESIAQLTAQVNQLASRIEHLKPIAAPDNPQKLFSTGVYYAKHKDYTHAAKWFRRAALAGHAKAMFYLGTMFIKAEGLPQSVIHSYIWMTLANIYGASEAKAVQQDLQKHLTAKELNLAQRLAADKYEEIEDRLLVQQQ